MDFLKKGREILITSNNVGYVMAHYSDVLGYKGDNKFEVLNNNSVAIDNDGTPYCRNKDGKLVEIAEQRVVTSETENDEMDNEEERKKEVEEDDDREEEFDEEDEDDEEETIDTDQFDDNNDEPSYIVQPNGSGFIISMNESLIRKTTKETMNGGRKVKAHKKKEGTHDVDDYDIYGDDLSPYDDDNDESKRDDNQNADEHFDSDEKDILDGKMLGNYYGEFADAINSSGALSIDERGNVENAIIFKEKCINKIDNCQIRFYCSHGCMKEEATFLPDKLYFTGNAPLAEMKLCKSDDRARFLNKVDEVLKYIDQRKVKNVSTNPLRKINQKHLQRSVPFCLRYVGYAALCDVLPKCLRMTYKDVGTHEGNNIYAQVVAITKALSLEGTSEKEKKHGKRKKKAFIDALRIWKKRYEEILKVRNNNDDFEKIINEKPHLSLYDNNRSKNIKNQPFTHI